MIFIFIF